MRNAGQGDTTIVLQYQVGTANYTAPGPIHRVRVDARGYTRAACRDDYIINAMSHIAREFDKEPYGWAKCKNCERMFGFT